MESAKALRFVACVFLIAWLLAPVITPLWATDYTGGGGHGDGANCSAGNFPLGVDADGAVQDCTAAAAGGSTLAASVYSTSTSNIPTSITTIAFTAENFDTDDFHDNSTNNSRITIPTDEDGVYLIQFRLMMDAQGTGSTDASVYLRLNGTTIIAEYIESEDEDWFLSENQSLHIEAIRELVAGDYLEVQIEADSTFAFEGNDRAERPTFAIMKSRG